MEEGEERGSQGELKGAEAQGSKGSGLFEQIPGSRHTQHRKCSGGQGVASSFCAAKCRFERTGSKPCCMKQVKEH